MKIKMNRRRRLLSRHRIKTEIKNNRGSASIEALSGFYIFMILLAILVSVSPVFIYKQSMDYMVNELVRMAEVTGSTNDPAIDDRYDILVDATGISPIVSGSTDSKGLDWSGTDYIGVTKKVQLNDPIMVKISYTYAVGMGAMGTFTIPMESSASGRSEVYTK